MLADSLVDRFGGYDRAAAEIVGYARQQAKRAPGRAMNAYLTIMKMLAAR